MSEELLRKGAQGAQKGLKTSYIQDRSVEIKAALSPEREIRRQRMNIFQMPWKGKETVFQGVRFLELSK